MGKRVLSRDQLVTERALTVIAERYGGRRDDGRPKNTAKAAERLWAHWPLERKPNESDEAFKRRRKQNIDKKLRRLLGIDSKVRKGLAAKEEWLPDEIQAFERAFGLPPHSLDAPEEPVRRPLIDASIRIVQDLPLSREQVEEIRQAVRASANIEGMVELFTEICWAVLLAPSKEAAAGAASALILGSGVWDGSGAPRWATPVRRRFRGGRTAARSPK